MRLHQFAIGCLVLFSCVISTASQNPTKDRNRDRVYAELDKAPEKIRARVNPLAGDPQAASAGRILFEEHCIECHGQNGVGTKRAPSLRAVEVQEAVPGAIFWILSNGVVRRGMPVWSKLPEPQRWQLVSYIKSLERTDSSR